MTEQQIEPSGRVRIVEPEFPPGTGRAVLIGTVVGALVVGLFAGGVAMAFGVSFVGAAGVAGFTAFWGGPGFGGMMGFVLHDARSASSKAP